MKPKAPKNFREPEVCHKVARRSAGLDSFDSATQISLVHISESIEAFDQPLPVMARAVPDGTIDSCLTNLSK
jgi:hypothetical protein